MDSMSRSGKKSKGRQKIEIKRVEKESSRYVTFSKRKAGIFKKAAQLSTLCGAQVGVAIFSEHGKLFSGGHPDPQQVFDCFLRGQHHHSVLDHNPFLASSSSSTIRNEKDHNKCEGQIMEHWWNGIGDDEINNMRMEECIAFRDALLGLKINVLEKLDMVAVTKHQAESSFNQFQP